MGGGSYVGRWISRGGLPVRVGGGPGKTKGQDYLQFDPCGIG
jgi:hypothetical protein